MPRVKPNKDLEKDLQIQAVILKHMALLGMQYRKDVAVRIPMKQGTFNQKYKNPSQLFSVAELRRVYSILQVPAEERVGLN